MMPMHEWNRAAVQGLLADADRALALSKSEDVRGSHEIVETSLATARQNYIDLVRRSRPLMLTDGEYSRFLDALESLIARLRFFGAAV